MKTKETVAKKKKKQLYEYFIILSVLLLTDVSFISLSNALLFETLYSQ